MKIFIAVIVALLSIALLHVSNREPANEVDKQSQQANQEAKGSNDDRDDERRNQTNGE